MGTNIEQYNSPVTSQWNDAINAKVTGFKNAGVKVYTAYDKYGQLHYSTKSKGNVNNIVNQYNSQANPDYTLTSNGVTYTLVSDGNGGYTTQQKGITDIQNQYAQTEQATRDNYSGLDTQLRTMADTQKQTANAQYDTNAKNYYTQYMQNQKNLQAQLGRMGMTGGASESSAVRLQNNYGTNYANNEGQRANTLNSIESEYTQNVYNNSKALADQLNAIELEKTGAINTYNQGQIDAQNAKKQSAYEAKLQKEQTAYQMKLQDFYDGKASAREVAAYIKKAGIDLSNEKVLQAFLNGLENGKSTTSTSTSTDSKGNTTVTTQTDKIETKATWVRDSQKRLTKNGIVFTGTRNGVYYKNGKKFTGTRTVNGKKITYKNGKKVSSKKK